MGFNTALTRALGIKSKATLSSYQQILTSLVPVVQGGMQWVGYAELAAAVSNAGGLGIVRCAAFMNTWQSPASKD
jgi:NAD(P)H-dependent flavin oxidoreductase YrpB (nitropropane dioxygenase family)